MAMYGADVGQLRAMADRMDLAAKSLDSIAVNLHAQVQGARWDGADGVRFSSDWSRQYRPSLREVARRLVDAARAVRQNALDQERTSSSPGGAHVPDYRRFLNQPVPNVAPPTPPWFGAPGFETPPSWLGELLDDFKPQYRLVIEEGLLNRWLQGILVVEGGIVNYVNWAMINEGLLPNHLTGSVDDVARYSKFFGYLGLVPLAVSSYEFGEAVGTGDWDAAFLPGLEITLAFAAQRHPLGIAALVGYEVGGLLSHIGDETGVNAQFDNAVEEAAAAQGYGEDFHRYDGIGGVGNWLWDASYATGTWMTSPDHPVNRTIDAVGGEIWHRGSDLADDAGDLIEGAWNWAN